MKSFQDYNKTSLKKVTYILATKNRARLLPKTFQMIKKLKTHNDQFILIDGLSTDNTKEVVKNYKDLIDIFITESDLNTNHAYNKGIMLAQGEYIKYLCDDDIIYPNAMKQAIKIMDSNPDVELLICGGSRYRKSTNTKQIVYIPPGVNYGNKVSDVFDYGTNGIGFIIRRSAYPKAGIAPFDWNADLTFTINCIKNKVITKFCRIKLYHQTIYDFSINNSKKKERINDYVKLLKENTSHFNYYRFRFNLLLSQNKTLLILLTPLSLVIKTYHKIIELNTSTKNKTTYIWDGGFS